MNSHEKILDSFAPLTVIVGHYGVGKTNLSLNLAADMADMGRSVQLVDLDIVNPYFRSSDYQEVLEEKNVEIIAPNFAGTTLDSPSLSGRVSVVIRQLEDVAENQPDSKRVIIDAGGDDVGATALGRFAPEIKAQVHNVFYVINAYRNITQDINESVAILREIEAKSHLKVTGIINNSHLQTETTFQTVLDSLPYADAVSEALNLPLVLTTAPNTAIKCEKDLESIKNVYPVTRYVRISWDT